ncbi:DNA-binding XRE family transcriptional regulator [Sinobacterium caligoides]|uniref:DNA-binding XRE family transcriptional regulator n=1 Tax=Sinobacterium caligoides TaxID=933926 RepID=A0A3N2DPH1_9GAMM|nr:helix-turn-helix domain-containing protein [Sinobacterium caligoides]ROS01602.1 DNA-binding XRE family transcriptional regulator [Sinobacterium caligoides]
MHDLSTPVKKNAFGRLLKLWRNTRNMSQEELSLEVGVSSRHISFLETGRSNPGRKLVGQIAEVFKLSTRDRNNLLVAAGFTQTELEADQRQHHLITKTLQLTLSGLDPTPACASDAYGNIIMVNRAWVRLYQRYGIDLSSDGRINSYHLYFSNKGLKPYLVGWDDIACALLMNLQQEVLLTDDARALDILEELLNYPDIPENWQRRSDQIGYQHSFRVSLRALDGLSTEELVCVNHTVGATPFISEPRIIISSFHRTDGLPIEGTEELSAIDHPLLYKYF